MFIIGMIISLGLLTFGIFLAGVDKYNVLGNIIVVLGAILITFTLIIFLLAAAITVVDVHKLIFYPFAFK